MNQNACERTGCRVTRLKRLGLLAACASVLVAGISGTLSVSAETPPAGTVTRLQEQVPNASRDKNNPNATADQQTTALLDPAARLIVELNIYNCPGAVALDMDTYEVKATNETSPGQCPYALEPAGVPGASAFSKASNTTVDTADHLLFTVGTDGVSVMVISETTLQVVATLRIPQPTLDSPYVSHAIIHALSWFPTSDDLIVTWRVDYAFPHEDDTPLGRNPTYQVGGQHYHHGAPIAGVAVADVSIGSALAEALASGASPYHPQPVTPLWTTLVNDCYYPIPPLFFTSAAYRSQLEGAVFVPCQLQGSVVAPNGLASSEHDGVVKLKLDSSGKPDGKSQLAISPGLVKDFYFDPATDRGYMPQFANSGSDVLSYNGHDAAFGGETGLQGNNHLIFGMDAEYSGRLYAVTPLALTTIDGRHDPFSPGGLFRNITANEDYITVSAIPPTAAHPYIRVLLPSADANGVYSNFSVLADTRPWSPDPPLAAVDSKTYTGSLGPGDTLSTSFYNGETKGFGFHSVLVGGPASAANDITSDLTVDNVHTAGDSIPLGPGHRDLLGGVIGSTKLSNGSPHGAASALGDGNGSTASGYGRCTNATGLVGGCLPGGGVPLTGGSTAQRWPFPDAECSGLVADSATDTRSGFYITSPSAGNVQGSQYGLDGSLEQLRSMVPGSADAARAHVDCGSTGVKGDSYLGRLDLSGSPVPIEIASVGASSTVQPPTDAAGVISTATATAKGVRVSLPGSPSHTLSIGEVSQTVTVTAGGRPGTAATTHWVVTITNLQLDDQKLCDQSCSQTALDQLNQHPTLFQVFSPSPDPDMRAGSPGGYQAAWQANKVQRIGDEQFNGMNANDSTLVPALRIIVYNPAEGRPAVSRQILDLAGVEADAELAKAPAPKGGGGQRAGGSPPKAGTAGTAGSTDPGTYAGGTPYDLGTAAIPATFQKASTIIPHTIQRAAAAVGGLKNKGLSAMDKTFSGLQWLARSPLEALQMGALLSLLGLPALAIARRRLWLTELTGEGG